MPQLAFRRQQQFLSESSATRIYGILHLIRTYKFGRVLRVHNIYYVDPITCKSILTIVRIWLGFDFITADGCICIEIQIGTKSTYSFLSYGGVYAEYLQFLMEGFMLLKQKMASISEICQAI